MQLASGSLAETSPVLRSSKTFCAHGVMDTSPGFRPTVASLTLGGSAIQIPVRSGLPSARRGAGAAKLGLPSAVRGAPLSLTIHWAASGEHSAASRVVLNPILFSITRFSFFHPHVTEGLYNRRAYDGEKRHGRTHAFRNLLMSPPQVDAGAEKAHDCVRGCYVARFSNCRGPGLQLDFRRRRLGSIRHLRAFGRDPLHGRTGHSGWRGHSPQVDGVPRP